MRLTGVPLPPGLPAHVVTTRHLCAAYPLVAEAGLGHDGVLIGRDVLGGSFVYDPFALYRSGVVTNPNMVVIGQIGRGKRRFDPRVIGVHGWAGVLSADDRLRRLLHRIGRRHRVVARSAAKLRGPGASDER